MSHSADASLRDSSRHTGTQHPSATSSFRSSPAPVRGRHASTSQPADFSSLKVDSIRHRKSYQRATSALVPQSAGAFVRSRRVASTSPSSSRTSVGTNRSSSGRPGTAVERPSAFVLAGRCRTTAVAATNSRAFVPRYLAAPPSRNSPVFRTAAWIVDSLAGRPFHSTRRSSARTGTTCVGSHGRQW